MQPSDNNDPIPLPSLYEFNSKNTNSKDDPQHHLQEIELQLQECEPKSQYLGSIYENPLYNQTTSGYRPIYQPIPMSTEKSTENSQQPLVHHIEDDVPPPKQPEPPKTDKVKVQRAKRARRKCWKKDEDDYLDVQIETTDRVLFFIFLIFVFGTFGLLISFQVYHSKKSDTNLSTISGGLSYIAFNLASHPILDIRVQDNSIPCPEDYSSMVLGTWPGTVSGCLCGHFLKRGACDKSSDNPQDTHCDDIAPRSPINMFDWGEEKWCVLRAKPGNEYQKAAECSEGFRRCSSGICMLESLNCPVTEIRKEGSNFVAEIVEGESPMIDVRISPNNISCFGVDSFARGPVPMYILMSANEWGCSKYGLDDEYSFFLDSQKQKELFYQNDFPLSVLGLQDYRYVYEHTNAVLSYRKRLDIAEKDFCLNLDTGLLEKASKAMHDLQRFISGTLTAGIIINSMLCMWVGIYIMPTLLGCNSLGVLLSRHLAGIFLGPTLTLGLMVYVDITVMFGATIHFRGVMLEMQEYSGKIEGMGCFLDEKAQSVMSDYQVVGDWMNRDIFRYSLALFIVSTVTIFPSFYLLWRCIRRDS